MKKKELKHHDIALVRNSDYIGLPYICVYAMWKQYIHTNGNENLVGTKKSPE